MYIMRFLSIFKCKTKRNIKKKNRKTRKQIKKLSRGGGKYNDKPHSKYRNDNSLNDNCDALPDKTEANRFFKLKCYMRNKNDRKVDAMVNKLIEEYRELNSATLQRGALPINTPFMNYIDKNYTTFGPFSKDAVTQIYTRFQEEAIPTMQYIS